MLKITVYEMSEYRGVGLLGCWTIGMSAYWGVGLLGCRTIGAAPRCLLPFKDGEFKIRLFNPLMLFMEMKYYLCLM